MHRIRNTQGIEERSQGMLHYIDLHTDNSYLWRPPFTFIVNSTIDCAWHTLLDKTTSDSGIVICNYRYVLHYYVWCDIFMVKIQFLINKRMLNWVMYMNSDSIREIFDQQLNYDQSLRSYFENFFFLLVNRGKKCFSLKERWLKYPMVNYSQWFVSKRSEYISLFSVHILSVCKSFGIFLMFLFPWYDTMLKKRKYLHQLVSLLVVTPTYNMNSCFIVLLHSF